MPLPATDVFTRADGTGLGANWTAVSNNFDIVSNQCQGTTLSDYNIVYWDADAFPDDQYSQCIVVTIGADGGGPAVRVNGVSLATADMYNIDTRSGGTDSVLKLVDGVETNLGPVDVDYANGDVAKIAAVGTAIKAYKNGLENGTFADSAITSGSAGIMNWSNLYLFDDWEGGDVDALPIVIRDRKLSTQQRMTS